LRIYTMYRPLKAFLYVALAFFLAGGGVAGRFLYFHLTEEKTGHVQSLVLASIFLIVAFMVALFGILADLVSANRKLLEDALVRLRRLEYDGPKTLHSEGLIDKAEGAEKTPVSSSPSTPQRGDTEAPREAQETLGS